MATADILSEILETASTYSARDAHAHHRIYGDLDINGGDFIEFVVAIERRYGVDLSWVAPFDRSATAQDPTIQFLTDNVAQQLADR